MQLRRRHDGPCELDTDRCRWCSCHRLLHVNPARPVPATNHRSTRFGPAPANANTLSIFLWHTHTHTRLPQIVMPSCLCRRRRRRRCPTSVRCSLRSAARSTKCATNGAAAAAHDGPVLCVVAPNGSAVCYRTLAHTHPRTYAHTHTHTHCWF